MAGTRVHGNVRVEQHGRTTYVVLARPDRDNALDLATASDLRDAFQDALGDSTSRVIVLRGEGKRFSVGGDLQGFRNAPADANLCDSVARPINETIEMMQNARQPVVCIVHGAVGGGATGLVLAADVVLAAQTTVFRLGYTGSGLTPDCGVTWHLPHRVGFARAMDLALTNRRLSADEACDWGIVSRVVPDDQIDTAVDQVVAALAKVPVATLSETKRLVRRALTSDLHSALDDEARTIGWIGDTSDTREAIAAFLDKRPPQFSA